MRFDSHFFRFAFRFLCFAALQIPIVGWVCVSGHPQKSDHYLSAWIDKTQRLADCRGPRLILVGGSNLAFGMNSENLRSVTGLEPVNLGLHAALGVDYQLRQVERYCRDGDVVVLCLEYEAFLNCLEPSSEKLVDKLIFQVPDAAGDFRPTAKIRTKQFLDRNALMIASRWVKRAYKSTFKSGKGDGPYCRRGFNKYGDKVDHLTLGPREFDPGYGWSASDHSVPETILKLNRFAKCCRQKGVITLYSFPPITAERWVRGQQAFTQIENSLRQRAEVEVIGSTSSSIFDLEEFFDSPYHLRGPAIQDRSKELAILIRDSLSKGVPPSQQQIALEQENSTFR